MTNIDYKLPPFTVKQVAATFSQSDGWQITKLHVPNTWTTTQGEEKTVLVIDTGCPKHPDVNDAIIINSCVDYIQSNIYDENGHSSHCCGIIGARNNEIGMVGVAPKCNIVTYKVLGADGTGSGNGILHALQAACVLKPDVISMSLGFPSYDAEVHNVIKKLYDMNIPIIAAAGNNGTPNSINYPAKYPETIAVTAFDENEDPAWFNSTGDEVDTSAPGVDIYSTYLNGKYAKLSGTSMATPFIAGVVALLLAKHDKQEAETGANDCVTIAQIREHLIKYSIDKGSIGRDSTWGYGVVDVEKLINDNDLPVDPIVPVDPVVPVVPVEPVKPTKSGNKFFRWLKKIFNW